MKLIILVISSFIILNYSYSVVNERQSVIQTAESYLQIPTWQETGSDTVTFITNNDSEDFQTIYYKIYEGNDKIPFLYKYDTGFRDPNNNIIINKNLESDANEGSFNIMPYAFGVYNSPNEYINRIKNDSIVPGGFDRKTGQGTEYYWDTFGSLNFNQIAGIECTGFVTRAYKYEHPDNSQYILDSIDELKKISLPVDTYDLKGGDFFSYPTHNMLFGGWQDKEHKYGIIYEAQDGFNSGIFLWRK